MPTKQRPFRLLRKFAWWLAGFVLVNIAFYIVIPLIAANYIKRHLETQGFTSVQVELGYPSPTKTYMPFLTLQKDLEEEHLSLTVRNLELTYVLTELLQGHIRNISIEHITIDLESLPSIIGTVASSATQQESLVAVSPEPPRDESHAVKESGSMDPVQASLVSLARLLPVLPFESFTLGNVRIYRAGATGPFRRMEMSGSVENQEGLLRGVMTFRGENIIPYSLLISVNPSGNIAVVLRSNELLSDPLLQLDSRIESSAQTGIAMHGTMNADLKQLTPFLALFMPLGSDLHKVDGNLHMDWEGNTSHDVTVETLFHDPQTRLSGAFQFDLRLPAWAGVAEDISVKVSGQVKALPQEIKVNISAPTVMKAQLHSDALALASEVKTFLVEADDVVTFEVKDHFETTLSFNDAGYTWAVEGFLKGQYGSERSPLGVQVTLLRASGDGGNLWETEGHLHSWGRVFHLPQDWAEVEKLEWDIAGDVTSAKQQVELNLAPGTFVSTADLQKGNLVIPESFLQLNQPWRIIYDSQTQEWKADLLLLPIALPKIHWSETKAAIQKTILHITQFHGDPTSWEMNGKALVAGIAPSGESPAWPVTNCGIGFWVKPKDVTLGIKLETLDKSVSAQGRIDHHFETRRGNLFATLTPQPFSVPGHRLSHLLKPWSFPFDVTSGEIFGKVAVLWGPDESQPDEAVQVTRGEFTLTTNHLDGSYHGVDLKNVNTTLTLIGTGMDNVAMPVPAVVTVESVSSGVTARDFSFTLQLGFDGNTFIPTFDIKDLVAHVFDGVISSPRIYLNTTQSPNVFVLKLDGLKLDKILQLEQQQDLEGTGVLNGFVPITLHGSSVEINDGKVEAQPPGGLIRFRPLENAVKKLSQTNFNMDVVLRALTNFHYDVLTVSVNYAPTGILKLFAQLEGKNPDMEHGQPIHFNMNIEENVPALLDSLRMVKDIEQQVDKLGQKLLH